MRHSYAKPMAGLLSAAACALAIGTAPAAHAVIITTATFQGTVALGAIDTLGAFGPVGASLGGEAFTMRVLANDSVDTHTYVSEGGVESDKASGPMSASLTIGEQNFLISGNGTLVNVNYTDSTANYYLADAHEVIYITPALFYTLDVTGIVQLPFSTPTTPSYQSYILSGAVWNPSIAPNYFITKFQIFPSIGDTSEYITLDSNILTVNSVNPPGSSPASVVAVPEPATWAMLILGLGLIGLAARRGRDGLAHAA